MVCSSTNLIIAACGDVVAIGIVSFPGLEAQIV